MIGSWDIGGTWLWPALIVVGVLMVAYAVLRLVRDGRALSASSPGGTNRSALRILGERYARGEIDDEEYQRRRAVLS